MANIRNFSSDTNKAIKSAVSEFGTPLYVYEEEIFESQFLKLSDSLSEVPHKLCYAVKSNSNLTILSKLACLGSGFDIVSGGELHRVLAAKADCSSIVFAGVGKTEDEIRLALASEIRFFNIESHDELNLIEAVAKEMSVVARVSFRVNPNIAIDSHPYIATGNSENKFGISIEEILHLSKQVLQSKHLSLIALSSHIGSQISDITPYEETLIKLIKLADELNLNGAKIKTIDLGGGLGVSFSGKYTPLDLKEYSDMIKFHLRNTDYNIIVEPGKFIIAESGSLITKILVRKKQGTKEFLIVDAGMNDLMRPALYNAFHAMHLLDSNSRELETYNIAGPVCESGCVFAYDYQLQKAKTDDLLAIRDAGAYGFSMASNYNSRPRPAEVLIQKDGSYNLIRPREDIRSLFESEKINL